MRNIINIAIIPARKGSKRYPGKNRAKINGKSLVEHAILCAENTKIFDHIILSTDDEKFFNLRSHYPFLTIRKRPSKISQDVSTPFEVISDVLNANYGLSNVRICYLQPTSPLRTEMDLVNSVSDNSISVYYDEENIMRNGHRVSDILKDLRLYDHFKRNMIGLDNYFFNGFFYWITVENLYRQRGFIGSETCFVETPISRSIDIDYKHEFDLARLKFFEMHEKGN